MPLPLIILSIVVVALVAGTFLIPSPSVARSVRTVLLLAAAAFCGYGFLASFELPGMMWKAAYAALGCGAIAGAALPWLRSKPANLIA
ncbi:hypothetical protein SV7mr_48520 [Stieleria bergensis]|uniref:Uncharacterized protein n=1 Tax=Stieleria bergensis TaxID=2528025 RepID=A0A517T1P3_9BACT|nr:hypothetical protein SV7mr_48520 [Planctomycetes bacterium SV_7m_r]